MEALKHKLSYSNDDVSIAILIDKTDLTATATIEMLCSHGNITKDLAVNTKADDYNVLILTIKREVLYKINNWKQAFQGHHTMSMRDFNRIKKLLFGSSQPIVNYVQPALF